MNEKSGEKILEEHFFIKEILGFGSPEKEILFPHPLKFCHMRSQDFPKQLLRVSKQKFKSVKYCLLAQRI